MKLEETVIRSVSEHDTNIVTQVKVVTRCECFRHLMMLFKVQGLYSIEWNLNTVMDDDYSVILKKSVLAYFKAFASTEKNHENL